MNMRHVAWCMRSGHPFYGLQHRGVEGRFAPHRSVPEMALECFEHVRRLQPVGPYFVGGFSAGGVVAFELAQLLARAGHTVAALIFFDTRSRTLRDYTPLERLSGHFERLRQLGPRYLVERTRHRLQGRAEWLKRKAALNLAPFFRYSLRNEVVAEEFERALAAYQPLAYHGYTALLRATEHELHEGLGARTNDDHGWRPLIEGRLEVIRLEGTHTSMVDEQHAEQTALALDRVLEHAGLDSGAPKPAPKISAAAVSKREPAT